MREMIDISTSSRILVVAAHPDDEILGCGGCVCKWSGMGAEVRALVLAEGLTSRTADPESVDDNAKESLRENARESAEIVGYESICFESFPDNRMDSVDLLDVVLVIGGYIDRLRPDIVLTHHHGDLNIDHRVAFQAVITACRPLAVNLVKTILSFETPSATEWNFPYYANTFSPNVFIDISEHIDKKLEALSCYVTESREAPHPRSLESLRAIASRWGSVVERPYVEALELIRTVSI